MPEDTLRLVIEGKSYELEDMELGEIEELEDAFGLPLDKIDLSRAKALSMLVYFVKRREDPDFTLEDARKIRISKIGGEETPDGSRPTKPKPAPTRAGSGRRS